MSCRLCLADKTLMKSHVIPELLYKPMYGAKHHVLSVHPGLDYIRELKKGLREKLLCGDCERLLSKYESYFSQCWYGEKGLADSIPLGTDAVLKEGLNYSLFKLFHLSIIWRASVSSLSEFSGTSLGPHEEKLRLMLLRGEPGAESEYTISGSIILRSNQREVHKGFIAIPQRMRILGKWHYAAAYAGCFWMCSVGRSSTLAERGLRESGALQLLLFDQRLSPGINDMLARTQLRS